MTAGLSHSLEQTEAPALERQAPQYLLLLQLSVIFPCRLTPDLSRTAKRRRLDGLLVFSSDAQHLCLAERVMPPSVGECKRYGLKRYQAGKCSNKDRR